MVWGKTQSSDEKYVADPARRPRLRPEDPAPADPRLVLSPQVYLPTRREMDPLRDAFARFSVLVAGWNALGCVRP